MELHWPWVGVVYRLMAIRQLSREAAGMTKVDIEFLKVFYDVETDAELIGAMNRHIEKLQAKLTRFSPPEPAVTKLREG